MKKTRTKEQLKSGVLKSVFLLCFTILLSSQPVLAQTDPLDSVIYIPQINRNTMLFVVGVSDRPKEDFLPGVKDKDAHPVDVMSIKDCTHEQLDALNEIDWANLPPPDEESTEGCRLPRTNAYRIDGGATQEEVNASNLFWPIKYSTHVLNCVSACSSTQGIVEMYGVVSAKEPTLAAGKSWDDFFYANFIRVSDRSNNISCQNGFVSGPSLYMGVGKGKATADNVTLSVPTFYWEEMRAGYCYGFTTYFTVSPSSALAMSIYKDSDNGSSSSYWTGRAWVGYWLYTFTHVAMPWGYSADTVVAGQMIHAKNSDHTSMTVPMNFVHKLELKPYTGGAAVSWSDLVLPSPLNGKTTSVADPVFNVMDLVAGEYTSISSER